MVGGISFMKCPKCNNDIFEDFETKGAKFKICTKCGQAIQIQQSDEYDNFCQEQQAQREQQRNKPVVECPYCHSTNTKKISGMSKAGAVALFGIFAISKTSKQWHCNNCKSDF